jgi:large subunit ribosomal protein L22
MAAKAKLKFIRISTRKVRLAADLIKGKKIEDALNILIFNNRRASSIMLRLLRSAVANAEEQSLNAEDLYVNNILVDQGPSMKRMVPRARRRASTIKHRMTHITIELDTINEEKSEKK